MRKIRIHTKSRPGIVYCGEGAFEQGYEETLAGKELFVVTDSNVARLYADLIEKYFGNAHVCVVPAGEKNKNHKTLFSILDEMVRARCHRKTVLVAFGGGVVGDVGGFAASLYMRGTRLVQIPTTLLAQVDSSVGGKTAIDYRGYKNIVGSFYQPEQVLCDPRFLTTLPKREIRCGLGEIVKTAALDAEIFDILQGATDFGLRFLEKLVPLCVRFKAGVVERDERETAGLRQCLNLGHTTAHALELDYGRRSHGEYVLIGMAFETKIALAEGVCKREYADRILKIVSRALPKMPRFPDIGSAAENALLDKKNSGQEKISLVVPKARGEYAEISLPLPTYAEYLKKIEGGLL